MAYRLYIGNKNYSSWSLRPWLLMSTLNIPFDEVLIPFDDGNSWRKFRQFSPTGLVPCLHDHGENPATTGDPATVVWESLAIVEYIAEQYPQVWPEDRSARGWARSATGEMHAGFSALRNSCPMSIGHRIKLHNSSDALKQDLIRIDELWQEGTNKFGGPFLAGEHFTAVDAFFAPVVMRLITYGFTAGQTKTSKTQAYCALISQLPAMQLWTTAALKETFREPSHELEFQAIGEITEDLRAQPS